MNKPERAFEGHRKAIRRKHSTSVTNRILKLARELALEHLVHYEIHKQDEVVTNVLEFASKGHPWETLKQYRDMLVDTWYQIDGCYSDGGSLQSAGADDGQRGENVRGHIEDLINYIPDLTLFLREAIKEVGPKWSSSIFPVLSVFQKYRSEKLWRSDAWAYQTTFLGALSCVGEELAKVAVPYNPLKVLESTFDNALGKAQEYLPKQTQKLQHHLAVEIKNKTLKIADPFDSQGMEAVIKAVLQNQK